MVSTYETTCIGQILAESDWGDILYMILILALGIGSAIFKKAKDANERKQVEEAQRRIDARKKGEQPDSGTWKKVESKPDEIQAFLAQAKQRKLERKKRVRMLKKDMEDNIPAADEPDIPPPLPSEMPKHQHDETPAAESYVTQKPARAAKKYTQPKIQHPDIAPRPQPQNHDNCQTTHRLLKDTEYTHDKTEMRHATVKVDLSSSEKLRQAVIMSEILATPKGLRDDIDSWSY